MADSKVTVKMVQAAIKQLVLAGILPRTASTEVYEEHWRIVRLAIEKALELEGQEDY